MQVIERAISMKKYADDQRKKGRSIGFVSTMGCLDKSHVALINRSKRENDITIVSIFVNIAMFQSSEEFKRYPRDFEHDYKISEESGADAMFFPETADVFNAESCVFVDIDGVFAGTRSRGIATAFMKMVQIIKPDRFYLSQKNIREVALAQRVVSELYMDTLVISCPIEREDDGLAISYKNSLLSPEEREQAPILNMALEYAKMEITHGERNASHLKRLITTYLTDSPLVSVDYVSIISHDAFKEPIQMKGKTIVEIGVSFPSVQLDDNMVTTV